MSSKVKHAFQYLWQWPQFVRGLRRLSRLKQPIVSVFGGAQAGADSHFYKQAYELGSKLVEADFSVITGGGQGIMEAALCGGLSKGKKDQVLGISIVDLDEPFQPRCQRASIYLSHFAVRKWLLIHYSCAYVIFPGGIGTLDELAEVINLIKAKEIERVPVILVGSSYWVDFTQWVSVALTHGFIDTEFKDLFTVTDDIDAVVRLIGASVCQK